MCDLIFMLFLYETNFQKTLILGQIIGQVVPLFVFSHGGGACVNFINIREMIIGE